MCEGGRGGGGVLLRGVSCSFARKALLKYKRYPKLCIKVLHTIHPVTQQYHSDKRCLGDEVNGRTGERDDRLRVSVFFSGRIAARRREKSAPGGQTAPLALVHTFTWRYISQAIVL